MKSEKLWKLQSESFFLCLRFVYTFLYRESSGPTWKKSIPPKVPIPPKILIWPKSLLYKYFEKWLSPSLSHPLTRHHPVGGRGCKLWYYTYFFLYHNIQSWFYMFYYSFYSIKELCCKSKAESLQMQKQKTFHLNPHMSYQLKCHTNTSHP